MFVIIRDLIFIFEVIINRCLFSFFFLDLNIDRQRCQISVGWNNYICQNNWFFKVQGYKSTGVYKKKFIV